MKYPGARSMLMKTSQCAEKAARIYPDVVRLMDEAGVALLDRATVIALLEHAMACYGQQDSEPPETSVTRLN